MPRVRIAVGCHPHNAKYYDDGLEADLRRMLKDPRVAALGEIGLDYHYDFSPRDDQREAFRRQLRLAKEAGLPVVLHLREAHDEALAITTDDVKTALDGVPVDKVYTLHFAIEAVRALIGDYLVRQGASLEELDAVVPCNSLSVPCMICEHCSLRSTRVELKMANA